MSTKFENDLAWGAAAERVVGHHLKSTAWVLDTRLGEVTPYRGPRMGGPRASLVLPDLLVFGEDGPTWVEVKRKAGGGWQTHPRGPWAPGLSTGLNTVDYHQYKRIQEETGIPVTVYFVHDRSLIVRDREDYPELARLPGGVYRLPLDLPCQHRKGRPGDKDLTWYALWSREDEDDTRPTATRVGDTRDLFAAAGEAFNPAA